jgi:hypothetical protein
MSVSGIASTGVLQLGTGPLMQPSRRQSEDQIGRQLEQDLQNGDLQGAQQAYQQLAAFGPNNSGPFSDPTLKSEFQALGTDLASGNLTAAQSDNTALTHGLMAKDIQTVRNAQNGPSANPQALASALANLKGDYWAVYGSQPNLSQLQSFENGGNQQTSISVQA